MKSFHFTFFFLSILLFTLSCTQVEEKEVTKEIVKVVDDMEVETPEKVLRHVVIFKFKDDADQAAVADINKAFNALPDAIPEIIDFEWGMNNSPEGLDQDFTHCYLITFASEEDRDSVYLPHPAHQAFVAGLQPHLEKAFVVDYWTTEKAE